MGSIIVYSDPHQGLNLNANTTPRSRERLNQSIDRTLNEILSQEADSFICLGDFFHRFQNSEDVLMDALPHAERTTRILGGNHDVVNDKERRSTLHVINEIFPGKVSLPVFGEVVVETFWMGSALFTMVPHHSSTELFEKALDAAVEKNIPERSQGLPTYLCLHCNYDSGFATQDTALNLDRKRAEQLLESFDYILIGHDHHFKEDFDGKLIVLGNIHPTNFGDICDKYYLVIDTDTGHPMAYDTCWVDNRYIEVDHTEIFKVTTDHHQFVRITGNAEPSAIPEISRSIKKLWERASEDAVFAIRSEVKIISDVKAAAGSAGLAAGEKITTVIEKELADQPELLALWKEVSHVEEA